MKRYYCTYFDINYLAQGLVLLESLQQHSKSDFTLYVLCLDENVFDFFRSKYHNNVVPIAITQLESFDPELLQTKNSRSWVEYIFTITPCIINYIVETKREIDCISYLDSDIIFFSDPEVIFDEFDNGSAFIVPHNFSEKNKHMEVWGKYNVGIVGFRNDTEGVKCIKWWREKCIEWCYDKLDGDRFADQKYLDQWPILFENVIISQNPGLNLAPYNVDAFRLYKNKKKYYVNDKNLVFYHYHRLKEFTPNLWELNLFDSKGYKDPFIKSIYTFIISRLKDQKKINNLNGKTSNRFQPNARKKVWMELKSNVLLFHFGLLSTFIDLRKPVTRILYYYNRLVS